MQLVFDNNTAINGGNDIYGASIEECKSSTHCPPVDRVNISSSISSVSSDPLRICVCDHYGVPQCSNSKFIYMSWKIHPGEIFTIPAVIVGWDFGTTTGIAYANYLPTINSGSVKLDSYVHSLTGTQQCTNLTFSLSSG